jgi:hypothetical protein
MEASALNILLWCLPYVHDTKKFGTLLVPGPAPPSPSVSEILLCRESHITSIRMSLLFAGGILFTGFSGGG